MVAGDQAGDGIVQLNDLRTQNALRAEAPDLDAVRRLSDRALQAAAVNPDHSPSARAAAQGELAARGIALEAWRVRVPSALSAADVARGDRLFFGLARGVRRASGFLTVLVVLGAVVGAIWLSMSGGLQALAPPHLIVAAVAAAMFPLIWLGAGLFRAKPARVLVFRSRLRDRTPLRRMIASELRAYGHVVSLAPAPGDGAVSSASAYRAVVSALRNTLALNARRLFWGPEVLSLSASAAWRPMLVDLLAGSADAVLVDLSEAPAERVQEIIATGALSRCVFISLWGKLETAEQALAAADLQSPCFYFAPDGEMQRRAQFQAALLAAMRATHGVSA